MNNKEIKLPSKLSISSIGRLEDLHTIFVGWHSFILDGEIPKLWSNDKFGIIVKGNFEKSFRFVPKEMLEVLNVWIREHRVDYVSGYPRFELTPNEQIELDNELLSCEIVISKEEHDLLYSWVAQEEKVAINDFFEDFYENQKSIFIEDIKSKEYVRRGRNLELEFAVYEQKRASCGMEPYVTFLNYLNAEDQKTIQDLQADYLLFCSDKLDGVNEKYGLVSHSISIECPKEILPNEKVDKEHTTNPMSVNVLNMNIQAGNVNLNGLPNVDDASQPEITEEQMKAAVEKCLTDFGSGRAWAVVYRIWVIYGFKGDFKKFETMVHSWGFEKRSKPLNYWSCMKKDFQSKLEGLPDDWECRGEEDFAKLGKKLEKLLGLRNVSDG